ncbi:MAG: polysaccharide lyase family protein [Planctomycetaceae bacterium]|nr:polysaccharide lyase family protein [Planctomycetaceae bacterium]
MQGGDFIPQPSRRLEACVPRDFAILLVRCELALTGETICAMMEERLPVTHFSFLISHFPIPMPDSRFPMPLLEALLFLLLPLVGFAQDDLIFQIGRPDARAAEFRHYNWEQRHDANRGVVFRYVVGVSRASDWSAMHLSTRDLENAGKKFTHQIEFQSEVSYDKPLAFVIGYCFIHATEQSLVCVDINGQKIAPKRLAKIGGDSFNFDSNRDTGEFGSVILEIPAGAVRKGKNLLSITLEDGSWFFYDYLALRENAQPLTPIASDTLLQEFCKAPMRDVKEILFVVRKPGDDPHWYANFGYYALDENTWPFPLGTGGTLSVLNVKTKEVRTIFKDPGGSIRDPQIHYDAEKCVFSYLPSGKRHFNLYEINLDGTGLRQLTFGDWDDIEPAYLPDGDIIFCSSRSKRWVQCWLTPVATLHRCGPDGENIQEVSANIEHDNTPWVLPNGQVLYMRWEYVDRSQVHYHHLWTMNPDGTRQSVFYGNFHPEIVMIDAKPIPDSGKVVAIFSPGHGIREHYGKLTVVDPRRGPDILASARSITGHYEHCDPWAFSEKAFMAARQTRIELIDGDGFAQTLYELPEPLRNEGFWIHEPRPIIVRERERIIPDQTDRDDKYGRLVLANIYEGRRMQDVKPGSIKELLVLETLPEPVHYSGGMDQISSGGTFTLERIVGKVPVAPDGSASMELPALRSYLFVAMDHDGLPVKRMHSFTSVMPGETTTCIGCHEHRTRTPDTKFDERLFTQLAKAPKRPVPVEGVPPVFDFPRDIQPILDKHCVSCHNFDRTDAGVNLAGDWTPLYTTSYLTLTYRKMFGDNRNRPKSDFGPYEIGSAASTLMKLIEEKHQGAELSRQEKTMVRYWLDVGANYAGTYAANGTGLIGWYYNNAIKRNDLGWPETVLMRDTISRRCDSCHTSEDKRHLARTMSEDGSRYTRHYLFNLTNVEKSPVLTAPLSKAAGGRGICETKSGQAVFPDKEDADYQTIRAGIQRGRDYILNESNRFSMTPFIANWPYTREMIRYGVLPDDHDPKTPIDPYETDRQYWKLFGPEE